MGGEGCNRPVINLKILMVFIPCPLALIQEHAERERLDLKKDLKVDLNYANSFVEVSAWDQLLEFLQSY